MCMLDITFNFKCHKTEENFPQVFFLNLDTLEWNGLSYHRNNITML
jgi:hypothetical protein